MNKSGLHSWSRLLVSTALCWHLHLAVVPGHAQPRFEGEGRVVAVDENQSTVTLDHGPILGLMPAMRMAFPVQPAEQLLGLQVGALVRFSLQARGLEWVIATIEPAGASKGSVMQMVVPFPSAETSVILPPSCCVTRLWTMYRPSPVLPCARLVVKNGLKT